jgi:excinuclease UvrABC nuclease subunit
MPGVYIVLDANYNTLYVGEAKNIYKRLKSKAHPVKKYIPNLKECNFICLVYSLDELRYRAETILIASLKPVYNDVKYLHGKVSKRGRSISR